MLNYRFSDASNNYCLLQHSSHQVRDAKIKVLTSLKQSSDEERAEWKKLSVSLKVKNANYCFLEVL